jgi:hypothetical protein
MLIGLGPKAPLDYSVFSSASAAFLLFAMHSEPERAYSRYATEIGKA